MKILLLALIILITQPVWSQTQNDTIFNYKTTTAVTIDGQADEDCWKNAEWLPIDQVWIPYNAKMKEGDFGGRFKVSWDEEYLYVLVEVVDDSLSDDHSNPLDSWWEDDCLEVFIDENRSMGDHERNNNAFAYHVSLFYDAVDLNTYGQGINYKDNIDVDMDTIASKTYLWEFAIKNYSASFNKNNPEASRVNLFPDKKMGFTIAYCDNDETTGRENFIGSVPMTAAHYNDMYKNADYFGLMILKEKSDVTNSVLNHSMPEIKIYPVPAKDKITIQLKDSEQKINSVSITTVTGQIVKKESFLKNVHVINISDLENGMYIITVNQGKNSFSKTIVKQN